jgi:hypothetical protein
VAKRKNHTLIEMARTMLDEYKTSDRFWAEVVNTACHATNRLYFHKLLKKTFYELITGNKPNVSYFRVFKSKCYILQKMSKFSKFAPKTYEGVLLGYDSNSHSYRVDAVFDETNDSQKEQVDLDLIDDEEASCDALQRMTIGDVWSQDLSNQPQKTSSNDTTPPHKVLIKIIMKNMLNQMIKTKKRAMVKGEIRMIWIKEKHYHIQECVKIFKKITPSTTYLVISKTG